MDYLKKLEADGRIEHVFIIGGGQVYADALQSPQCSAVHLTAVGNHRSALTFWKCLFLQLLNPQPQPRADRHARIIHLSSR